MTATNDGIIHLKGRIRDGKLVALLDHEGKELGAPVTSIENEFTGGSRFKDRIIINEQLPVVLIGGDHPYSQWYGKAKPGNGMAKAYLDRGLRPYIAICSDTPGMSPDLPGPLGASEIMTWAQCRELQAMGVEFMSHGSIHYDEWDKANSGITINYSGVAVAPTVAISATGLTLTGNGGAENATLAFATYPTLTTLAAAIVAQGGVWTCTLAPYLLGTEASANLLQVGARNIAASAKAKNFAASGGLSVYCSTSKYSSVYLNVTGTSLKVVCDGVEKYTFDLTAAATDTLAELVTNMNSTMTGEFVVYGRVDTPAQNQAYCYQNGDELSISLCRAIYPVMQLHYHSVDAGLPLRYIWMRNMERTKEVASAHGINLFTFAQSGGNMYPHQLRGISTFDGYRLPFSITGNNPQAMPMWHEKAWWTHRQWSYTQALESTAAAATFDALEASRNQRIDALIHKAQPDGSSEYDFSTSENYYDQTETELIKILDDLSARVKGGTVLQLTPSEANRLPKRKAPANLLFNPKFEVKAGANLLNLNPSVGIETPGYILTTPNSVFSAVSAIDSGLRLTATASTATDFVKQDVWLERGKTYEFGCTVDVSAYTSGSGVGVAINRARGKFGDEIYDGVPGAAGSVTQFLSQRITGQSADGAYRKAQSKVFFTVPSSNGYNKARAVSLAGPFVLSAGNTITINIFNKGALSPVVAGATPGATTADEVAAAINAAVLASGSYPAEYRNCARVVGGKVVIEAPYASYYTDGAAAAHMITITGGVTSTVFGGVVSAICPPIESLENDTHAIYRVGANISLVGTVDVTDFYLQELTWL